MKYVKLIICDGFAIISWHNLQKVRQMQKF